MKKLAVLGGVPVRGKSVKWPSWPISNKADGELLAKIARSNRWSYDGPYEWRFAEAFTNYAGAGYGLCMANGTAAIQLALEALDVGAHDEVILPGMTWQATAAACIDVNAVPVLVDVEPDTWCLDCRRVEEAITERTRAVIVVHLYGSVTDLGRLKKLCKDRGLYLIEDCAHQHGTFWKGKGVGAHGDIGTFSFQESKVMSCGEGGFNTCRSKRLFERLYSLRNCGRAWQDKSARRVQSGNYRITEFQAGLLLGALKRLDRQVKRRDRNVQYLNARLEEIPGFEPMRRRREVTQQSYFNFALRLDQTYFEGLTNRAVCQAVNAELSLPGGFEPPYEPLNRCGLYRPHTKRRHRIDEDYWKAIDPGRFSLPVSEDAHKRSGMVVHHATLMGRRSDMDDMAMAFQKVSDHWEALRAQARNAAGSFRARARW